MLVSLERSGGFTGRRVTSSVDTDELPAEQVTEALRALDALVSAPPAALRPLLAELVRRAQPEQ